MTWFLYAGRKSIGSINSVSIEVDLVFVWVVEIGVISVWRMELDLFQCRDEIDLVVLWVVEVDLISA